MRTLLQAILVVLIGSCPMWCEAMENTLGPKARLLTPADVPHPPVHNDCVCNGICDGNIHHAAPSVDFDLHAASLLTLDLFVPLPDPWEYLPAPAGLDQIPAAPPPEHATPSLAALQSFRC